MRRLIEKVINFVFKTDAEKSWETHRYWNS